MADAHVVAPSIRAGVGVVRAVVVVVVRCLTKYSVRRLDAADGADDVDADAEGTDAADGDVWRQRTLRYIRDLALDSCCCH